MHNELLSHISFTYGMVKGSSSLNAIFRMNSLLPDSVYTLNGRGVSHYAKCTSLTLCHIYVSCSQPLPQQGFIWRGEGTASTTAGFHMEGGKEQPLPQQGFIWRGEGTASTTAGFHMEGGRYSLYHSRVSYGGGKVQPLPQQGFIRRGYWDLTPPPEFRKIVTSLPLLKEEKMAVVCTQVMGTWEQSASSQKNSRYNFDLRAVTIQKISWGAFPRPLKNVNFTVPTPTKNPV